MSRKPNLLGFDANAVAGIMDYYEATMADINIVAGISGRRSLFNASVRGLRKHKLVGEDDFVSDGYTAVLGGKDVRFTEKHPNLKGKSFHVDEVEADNYLLNFGLEQILGFIMAWQVNDDLIKFFVDRGLNHETIGYFKNNRSLGLTIEAIPEGIPLFGHEPYLSVEGTFEQDQFPESLILGTWGFQTAIGTQASYVKNILEEFGRQDIITLEGGSRRLYPASALPATRSVLAAGFNGTSLVEITRQYPELKYKVGGSSGHSAVLHIGNDEEAFELQLRAYYGIKEGDSGAVIREKIKQTRGVGVTFLVDTFDSNEGLKAAIKVMKKYGIQSQVRNDSGDPLERVRYIRTTLDQEHLTNVRIMISDDLKPWKVYDLLKNGANFNLLLMGTYLVNPYRLPGPVYKIAADQPDLSQPTLVPRFKVCLDNPAKSTFPGPLDVYRIIGEDGKADRDVILLRDIDLIRDLIKRRENYIKLTTRVMEHNELVYDLPDMCQIIENTTYHLGLLRPEHKRFRNASEYPVIVSDTIQKIRENHARQFQNR